jgi:predicted ATP-grasp superfamily ATP-dependent carboligase
MLDGERQFTMLTRFGSAVTLPYVDDAPGVWLQALDSIGRTITERPALFVTSDAPAELVAEHRAMLAGRFRFILPSPGAVRTIINKRLQYELATSIGIALPQTRYPESAEEARACVSEFAYPCILKPCKSHVGVRLMGVKVAIVHSPDELVRRFAELTADGSQFMVQEIVPGDDDTLFAYDAFWDERSNERYWLTRQKLRQSSRFGTGSYQVTVDQSEVAELGRRMLTALAMTGFGCVEFRRDARDGVFRLMEVNGRTGANSQLAVAAGIDWPWLGYCHLTGASPSPAPQFRRGVRLVNEEWDTPAFLARRRSGELGLFEWARQLVSAEAHAIFAWDDPLPLLAAGALMLRREIRRRINAAPWTRRTSARRTNK